MPAGQEVSARNEVSMIMGWISIGRTTGIVRTLLTAALLWGLTEVANADDFPAPQGPVVLTVSGSIAKTNRGGLDALERRASLFEYHEITFERAAEFDLGALERLGVQTIAASDQEWPKTFTFEGPLLRDVLAAVGATGRVVRVVALDGYAAEIAMSEIQTRPFIVAVKRDGRYLGIGDQGPTWIVASQQSDRTPGHEVAAKHVWSAFYIMVE